MKLNPTSDCRRSLQTVVANNMLYICSMENGYFKEIEVVINDLSGRREINMEVLAKQTVPFDNCSDVVKSQMDSL